MDIHARVVAAVETLKPTCGREAINEAMAAGFEGLFATNGFATDVRSPAGLYVSAMRTGFYAGNPQHLSPEFRECVVLAVLVVQGADVNLALHVFIALASGISVADVLDVVFLAGMYSGANLLSQSMKVVTKAFSAIIAAADAKATGPAAVFQHIAAQFTDARPDDARAPRRDPL